MKSFKKLINEDLNKQLPELREDIKNEYFEYCDKKQKPRFNFKLVMPIASTFVAAMICIMVLILSPKNPQVGSTFMLEINPKVVFSVNEDEIVTNIVSLNEDADLILASEDRKNELIGKEIEESIVIFTDYAHKLGYLDSDSRGIKLSACGNNDNIKELTSSLENYLCDNGLFVVVYNEEVSVSDLALVLGVDSKTETDLRNSIDTLESVFVKRVNKTATEIKEIYESIISEETVAKECQKSLEKNRQELDKYLTRLDKIIELNDKIIAHDDNPGIFGLKLDYWTIIGVFDIENMDVSEDFKELLLEMRSNIKEFNKKYDENLDSLPTVILKHAEAVRVIALIGIVDLSEIILNLVEIVDILKGIDEEVNNLTNLLNAPNDKEDLLNKMDQYSNIKINDFKGNHDMITKADYQSWIDQIIEEYGSLKNYFEKK